MKSFEHYAAGYDALPDILREQLETIMGGGEDPSEEPGRLLFAGACFVDDLGLVWDGERPYSVKRAIYRASYAVGRQCDDPEQAIKLLKALSCYDYFATLPAGFTLKFFSPYRRLFREWERAQEEKGGSR